MSERLQKVYNDPLVSSLKKIDESNKNILSYVSITSDILCAHYWFTQTQLRVMFLQTKQFE